MIIVPSTTVEMKIEAPIRALQDKENKQHNYTYHLFTSIYSTTAY